MIVGLGEVRALLAEIAGSLRGAPRARRQQHLHLRPLGPDPLREAGFVVIEAVDAAEAVELLSANTSIALLFSDINMPGPADGNDLAAWVASRYPHIRVLLTSGIARDDGPPFIAKPYSFIELQRRIEAMLGDG